MTGPEEKKSQLFCPYCEEEIKASVLSCCRSCGVTIFYCPECRKPVERDKRVCPHCGVEIKSRKPGE